MNALFKALADVNNTQKEGLHILEGSLYAFINTTQDEIAALNTTENTDKAQLSQEIDQIEQTINLVNSSCHIERKALEIGLQTLQQTYTIDFQNLNQLVVQLNTTQQHQRNSLADAIQRLYNDTNTSIIRLTIAQIADIQQLNDTINQLRNITAAQAAAIVRLQQQLDKLYNVSNETENQLMQTCNTSVPLLEADIAALFTLVQQVNKSCTTTTTTTTTTTGTTVSEALSASEEEDAESAQAATPAPEDCPFLGRSFNWGVFVGLSVMIFTNCMFGIGYYTIIYKPKHKHYQQDQQAISGAAYPFADQTAIADQTAKAKNKTEKVEMGNTSKTGEKKV